MCEGDRTCCPAQTETALRHSAATDFHHAVRQSSHQLRLTLAHSATAIQGTIHHEQTVAAAAEELREKAITIFFVTRTHQNSN